MRNTVRQAVGWVAEREVIWVFLAAPWLLFPSLSPLLTATALIAICALWMARPVARRPVHVVTPANLPMLLLLLSLGIALVTGPVTARALSDSTTVILGVAVVSAFANGDDRWRSAELWSAIVTVGGLLFSLFSLIATDYPQGKISGLDVIARRLYLLGGGLRPASLTGLDANKVSGILVILLPVALGFALSALKRAKQPLMSHWQVYAGAGLLAAVAILFALVLTQSRTAIAVVLLTGVIVAGFRSRPVGVLAVALLVTVGMLLLIGLVSTRLDAWMGIVDGLGRPPGAELTAWPQRVELWQNALLSLRDYPLTGTGVGAFMQAALVNYPFHVMTPDSQPPSVPNLWLRAGADLGLLGLIAFAWLTVIILLLGWKIRSRRNGQRILLTGFWFGLVAWMGHGLLAGLWLAERLGLLVWVSTGVLLGGWLSGDEVPGPARSRRRLAQAGWVACGSLLALIVGWLLVSPISALNRGANLLDLALIDSSLSGEERAALLTDARSLLDESSHLPGVVRRSALVEYELGNDTQATALFSADLGAEAFLSSRGAWLVAEDQVDEAERLLRIARGAVPGSARLSCLSADVSAAHGDSPTALDSYRRGLDAIENAPDGVMDTKVRCYEGFVALAESLGWWDEVARWLGEITQLVPQSLEYQRLYGWALFRATGEIGEPVTIEEAVLRLEPDSVPTMVTLIDIYLEANRPQKALDWSLAAIGADNTNPGSWLRLAKSYRALEEFDQARSALSEALRLDPANPAAIDLRTEWQIP
jgi:O-antigen ligase/tetratricopeptide (TPR) repeat protein